jgi:predicted DNA-binding protein
MTQRRRRSRLVVVGFRVPPTTSERIREAAKADDRTPSAYLRRTIERVLDETASVSATE